MEEACNFNKISKSFEIDQRIFRMWFRSQLISVKYNTQSFKIKITYFKVFRYFWEVFYSNGGTQFPIYGDFHF
jgi:hypothetical protein